MAKRFEEHLQAPKDAVVRAGKQVDVLGLQLLLPGHLEGDDVMVGEKKLHLKQEGLYGLVMLLGAIGLMPHQALLL